MFLLRFYCFHVPASSTPFALSPSTGFPSLTLCWKKSRALQRAEGERLINVPCALPDAPIATKNGTVSALRRIENAQDYGILAGWPA